jgi:lysophospholipase L1-like esterase
MISIKLRGIVFVIVATQLVIVGWLLNTVYQKGNETGGDVLSASVMIEPLNKNDYSASPSANLKYFYEPKSNSRIVEDKLPWLKSNIAYTTNVDTLFERYDYDVLKPQGVYRIITLGDSFTAGLFVNTQDNWTELLEDKLNNLSCPNINKFEVINLAVPGYGPEYIKERYRVRGIKYSPDLIIWNESNSSFVRVNEILSPLLEKYQKYADDKEIYRVWLMAVKEEFAEFGYDNIIRMVEKSWQDFFEIRQNIPFVVTSYKYLTDDQRNLLAKWGSGKSNVYYFFGLPDLKKDGLDFNEDLHPNKDGHVAIAQSTFGYLKEHFFQYCTDKK